MTVVEDAPAKLEHVISSRLWPGASLKLKRKGEGAALRCALVGHSEDGCKASLKIHPEDSPLLQSKDTPQAPHIGVSI